MAIENMNKIEIPLEAVVALKSGDKVKAVKITKEHYSITLSAALDSVNAYLINNSDINFSFIENQKKRNLPLRIIINIGLLLLLISSVIHISGK